MKRLTALILSLSALVLLPGYVIKRGPSQIISDAIQCARTSTIPGNCDNVTTVGSASALDACIEAAESEAVCFLPSMITCTADTADCVEATIASSGRPQVAVVCADGAGVVWDFVGSSEPTSATNLLEIIADDAPDGSTIWFDNCLFETRRNGVAQGWTLEESGTSTSGTGLTLVNTNEDWTNNEHNGKVLCMLPGTKDEECRRINDTVAASQTLSIVGQDWIQTPSTDAYSIYDSASIQGVVINNDNVAGGTRFHAVVTGSTFNIFEIGSSSIQFGVNPSSDTELTIYDSTFRGFNIAVDAKGNCGDCNTLATRIYNSRFYGSTIMRDPRWVKLDDDMNFFAIDNVVQYAYVGADALQANRRVVFDGLEILGSNSINVLMSIGGDDGRPDVRGRNIRVHRLGTSSKQWALNGSGGTYDVEAEMLDCTVPDELFDTTATTRMDYLRFVVKMPTSCEMDDTDTRWVDTMPARTEDGLFTSGGNAYVQAGTQGVIIRTGNISAFSDIGGGEIQAASANHQLATGETVEIVGTEDYDGTEVITVVDADNFKFTAPVGAPLVDQGGQSSGAITAYASGSNTTVTSNGHGLTTGHEVQIVGTSAYDGTYSVTVLDGNTFDISAAFATDEATGTWYLESNWGTWTELTVNTEISPLDTGIPILAFSENSDWDTGDEVCAHRGRLCQSTIDLSTIGVPAASTCRNDYGDEEWFIAMCVGDE
jgi:hypothetical protein